MLNINEYRHGDKMTNKELTDQPIATHIDLESRPLCRISEVSKHGLCYDPAKGILPDMGRFPSSRDWSMPSIECATKTCAANYNGSCVMPSCIKIGANGKCLGNHPRKVSKKRKK